MSTVTLQRIAAARGAPRRTNPAPGPFAIEMMELGTRSNPMRVRVGRKPGSGKGIPLLLFNGIGGNIELLAPLAEKMPEREIVIFDIPGVGQSELPRWPYRLAASRVWPPKSSTASASA